MRKLLFLVVLLLLSRVGMFSLAQERLEPAMSIYDAQGNGSSMLIRSESINDNVELRYLIHGGFYNFFSNKLELTDERLLSYSKYSVVENIKGGYVKEDQNFTVEQRLSVNSAHLLKRLFRAATLSARFREDFEIILDASCHFFTYRTKHHKIISSSTYGNDSRTNSYLLIRIVWDVIEQLNNDGSRYCELELTTDLKKRIIALTERFEKLI